MRSAAVFVFATALFTSCLAVVGCQAQQDLGSSPDGGAAPTSDDAGAGAGVPSDALRIFMTQGKSTGDIATAGGKGSGLDSADALCQTAADGAGLDGRFVAYLSSGSVAAKDRLVDDGPFYTPDRKKLVYRSKSAFGGIADVQIPDERGGEITDFDGYWSGTTPAGTPDGNDCQRWTDPSVFSEGTHGWYQGSTSSTGACMYERRLLCVEQRKADAVPRKRVFVTSKGLAGDFGKTKNAHEAADAHCAAAAKEGGLGGAWIAWLTAKNAAGATVRADSRIPDAAYALLDGRLAFATKAELRDAPQVAIDITEQGAPIDVKVWTGTLYTGAPSQWNCVNWTVGQSYLGYGMVGYTKPIEGDATHAWTGYDADPVGGPAGCHELNSFYCFEM